MKSKEVIDQIVVLEQNETRGLKPENSNLTDCNPGPVEYSGNVATDLLGHH